MASNYFRHRDPVKHQTKLQRCFELRCARSLYRTRNIKFFKKDAAGSSIYCRALGDRIDLEIDLLQPTDNPKLFPEYLLNSVPLSKEEFIEL